MKSLSFIGQPLSGNDIEQSTSLSSTFHVYPDSDNICVQEDKFKLVSIRIFRQVIVEVHEVSISTFDAGESSSKTWDSVNNVVADIIFLVKVSFIPIIVCHKS